MSKIVQIPFGSTRPTFCTEMSLAKSVAHVKMKSFNGKWI